MCYAGKLSVNGVFYPHAFKNQEDFNLYHSTRLCLFRSMDVINEYEKGLTPAALACGIYQVQIVFSAFYTWTLKLNANMYFWNAVL